ncbi:acyl-CoA dehydrogenase family protein [Stakelama tenebrarum]|uniref:Pimeloyl-CoA dehydrogenase small subunit n=1 Tax=Stakelama tenebrarum TaxID=2711215 RepID=A0A6G6Y812_9SPHN|nr:acyl-CoA dehydrogenase family protein [Sphingosinithalassobacter tenebrarum]QIG81065.1 pimeloyl-CoA dehydrogenase small subunit [Sphingosinithalassobacter tenebrarum]
MDFGLTEEQTMLRDMLQRYLRDSYDFETRRKRILQGGPDTALWQDFAQTLGILAAPLPERAGGLGGGAIETMIVMEALGEALVPEPFLETVVIAGGLLARLPGEASDALLGRIAGGEAKVALAHGEPQSRYALHDVRTTAKAKGNGWVLDGTKQVVVGGPDAVQLIVSARTSGDTRDRDGIALFLLGSDAKGIEHHDYRLIDERGASDLMLRDVHVPGDALLTGEGAALPLIEQVIDEATAAVCAEAVGAMRRMVDDTVEYAKQRRQFGQPLAGFQVLQHRMVDMYMALEQAISAAYLATLQLDAAPGERARAVSAAKAVIGDAARFVGQNAVQLHGAMGMTEELAVGHYFKRVSVIEQQFGPADHHLARYAALRRAEAA